MCDVSGEIDSPKLERPCKRRACFLWIGATPHASFGQPTEAATPHMRDRLCANNKCPVTLKKSRGLTRGPVPGPTKKYSMNTTSHTSFICDEIIQLYIVLESGNPTLSIVGVAFPQEHRLAP